MHNCLDNDAGDVRTYVKFLFKGAKCVRMRNHLENIMGDRVTLTLQVHLDPLMRIWRKFAHIRLGLGPNPNPNPVACDVLQTQHHLKYGSRRERYMHDIHVWHVCMTYIRDGQGWHTCMEYMYMHDIHAWHTCLQTCMTSMHTMCAWHTCISSIHGIHAWCTCMKYMDDSHVWYTYQ